jgi:hypothetical protein
MERGYRGAVKGDLSSDVHAKAAPANIIELAHRREVRALKQSWPGLHRQILPGDVRSVLDNWTEHANAAGLSQGKIDELGRDFVLL